jgi:NTE family protein
VEIDGVPYWDGGYMANPALFPLFYETMTDDIVLVQINPLERRQTPRTAREIRDRLNEITFHSNLLRKLRAVAFVQRLIEEGKLSQADYKNVHLHRIDGSGVLDDYEAASRMKAEWDFFVRLRDAERRTARSWLAAHYRSDRDARHVRSAERFPVMRVDRDRARPSSLTPAAGQNDDA